MSKIIIALKNIFNLILSAKNISFYQKSGLSISLMGVAVTPSENYFNFLILIVSVCLLLLMYIRTESLLIISSGIILVLTLISIKFPMLSFLLMAFITGIVLIFTFPYNIYQKSFDKRKEFLKTLLHFLNKIDFLDFLAVIYIKFFFVPPKIFNLRLILMGIVTVLYIFTSRYYFYQKTLLGNELYLSSYIIISLILFLGIMTSYFRFLLNLALVIVPLTLKTERSVFNSTILYIFEGDNDSTASNNSNTPPHSSDSAKGSDRKAYEIFHQMLNNANKPK